MGSNLQKWKIGNQVEILGYKYSRVVEGFSTSRYYIFLIYNNFLNLIELSLIKSLLAIHPFCSETAMDGIKFAQMDSRN